GWPPSGSCRRRTSTPPVTAASPRPRRSGSGPSTRWPPCCPRSAPRSTPWRWPDERSSRPSRREDLGPVQAGEGPHRGARRDHVLRAPHDRPSLVPACARRGLRPLSFGGPRQDLLAGGARASGGDVRRCGGLSGLREAGRSAGASSGSGARRRPEELRHSEGPAILGGGGAFVLSPRGHAPFFLAIFAHSLLPRRADFAFPLTCSPARI